MSGKLSQTFLSADFVACLQKEARKYQLIDKARSKKEWLFGEMVNAEWEKLEEGIKQEVTREGYFVECSYWINEVSPFPLVASSGETLRRWCEVAASYQAMPGLELMRETLSFDHFRKARVLANNGKVSVPAYALAKAIEQEYTADEMVRHFDPPEPPNEYNRVTGWLDGLQTARFEWLAREKRERLTTLLQEIREILDGQKER